METAQTKHETFHYQTLDDVRKTADGLGAELPLSEDMSVLGQALALPQAEIPNRLAVQPMEGCDGTPGGAPGALTLRRYHRFAQSGAGLIWAEACAVVPEGRANPRQLMLTRENLDVFCALVADLKETSMKLYGYAPAVLLQETHSGRYSKPEGRPAALVACHNPILEKEKPVRDSQVVSDDYLKGLEEAYAQTAKLAQQAGFDGVDIKACHRYLMSETLSAFTRPGPYGGSFENRTRLYRNAVAAARAATGGGFLIASRLNLFDALPAPWGFGADEAGAPDMREPVALVRRLHAEYGMDLFDFSIGNPYFNPHINRPFDRGAYVPPEHPLTGVARICACTAAVKKAVPDVRVVASGMSYLRQFGANLAAGVVGQGVADMAGFGRMAFAYPAFAHDLLANGRLDPRQCCIACSKCTELMRAGSTAGCVVRDSATYFPIYKRDVLENPEDIAHKVTSM